MAIIGMDVGHGRYTFPPSKGVYRDGKGFAEYDANSRVGRVLKDKLEKAGHTVIMAQPFNANDVPLTSRTNKYFANKVDLIISCHANYNSNKSANGYAAFFWHNDKKAMELALLYEDEIKKQGFKLWGGARPSLPNNWSNFHMCRVPASKGVPSILLENGFMGNDNDFTWIFGSKRNEYAEKCATAAFNSVQRFLGVSIKPSAPKPSKPAPAPKPTPPSTTKSVSKMASEVIAGKHGTGHVNRRKSLGISEAKYAEVRTEVNRRSGVIAKPAKKPVKTIAQMAKEVIDNKHGNGHANRQKSLGINASTYAQVRAQVNKLAGVSTKPKGKTASQMATEVIAGKHGNGHANRRKSLGISSAEYSKVRAEVNRRA